MEAKKKYFMDCHLAGRMYHEADEVWDKLKVGTKVELVREADNRYDPNAVMVCYNDQENDEQVCLGYIPRSQNNTIALLLDMDYTNIFECRISQIDERAHPEQQVHLVIKVKRNEIVWCFAYFCRNRKLFSYATKTCSLHWRRHQRRERNPHIS